MNSLARPILTDIPSEIDIAHTIPRRVSGFATAIETSLTLEQLKASLDGMASASAFRLAALEETGTRTPAGARLLHAEFALHAPIGTTGDPQIFALLRDIAATHRWNGIEKRIERAS